MSTQQPTERPNTIQLAEKVAARIESLGSPLADQRLAAIQAMSVVEAERLERAVAAATTHEEAIDAVVNSISASKQS